MASALRTATGEFGWITGVGLGPASRAVHAGGTEVRIEVRAAAAPTPQQSKQLQDALAASAPLVERIDSLALTFTQG